MYGFGTFGVVVLIIHPECLGLDNNGNVDETGEIGETGDISNDGRQVSLGSVVSDCLLMFVFSALVVVFLLFLLFSYNLLIMKHHKHHHLLEQVMILLQWKQQMRVSPLFSDRLFRYVDAMCCRVFW
jgi:hypothetical protein